MRNKAFHSLKKSSPTSTHPKTIINRKYDTAKRGLDLAFKRADGAFRMSKSRKLRELHDSKRWNQLSEADRARAEWDIIAALEASRDEKKRLHEMEWKWGIDAREYFESESGESEENEEDSEMEGYEYKKGDRDIELEGSEWATCSEGEDNAGDLEVGHTPTLGEEYEEIKKAFMEGWKIKMKKLEMEGKEKEAAFRDYVHFRKH